MPYTESIPQHFVSPMRPVFCAETVRRQLWPDAPGREKHMVSLVAAVLDPVQWPGFLDTLTMYSGEWFILHSGPDMDEYKETMPYVVAMHLHQADDDTMTRRILSNTGSEKGIFMRLEMPFNPAQPMSAGALLPILANQLTSAPDIIMPDGGAAFLRYYDPHILHAWMQTATPKQLQPLYGAHVSDIWAEDVRAGGLIHYPRPNELPPPALGAKRMNCPKPRLGPLQLDALLEAQYEKYLQTVEEEILANYFIGASPRQQTDICHTIRELAAEADDHGFTSRKDIFGFVALGAKYGWGIYKIEQIRPTLWRTDLPAAERLRQAEILCSKYRNAGYL